MSAPDLEHIEIRDSGDGVALAILSRPDKMNALTFGMFDEILELARWLDRDDGVRALVLTGQGRGFCAGLDLADARTLPDLSPLSMLEQQEGWAAGVTSIARAAKPVIAAVNGAAAGAGLSLALAADIRICTPGAKFNAAFVRIGLSGGDCGSSWLLPRIIGYGRASDMLLTGRFVGAEEAERIGLVSLVVGEDELLEEARLLGHQIAANSPFGVRLTKSVLRQNVDAPSLDAALEVENRNQVLATRSPDMIEALTAFLEKRSPQFGQLSPPVREAPRP